MSLGWNSSRIHSLSFKCAGLTNIWVCSSSEMYKRNHVFVVRQQETETSLYFLNVCGLCSRENISTELPIIAVVEGLVENRRSGIWRMNGRICLLRLMRWRWWPKLAPLCAGTSLAVGRQRIYIMHCKSTAPGWQSGHVYKKRIFNSAIGFGFSEELFHHIIKWHSTCRF